GERGLPATGSEKVLVVPARLGMDVHDRHLQPCGAAGPICPRTLLLHRSRIAGVARGIAARAAGKGMRSAGVEPGRLTLSLVVRSPLSVAHGQRTADDGSFIYKLAADGPFRR